MQAMQRPRAATAGRTQHPLAAVVIRAVVVAAAAMRAVVGMGAAVAAGTRL
jgi:hypothetical protein